MEILDKVRREVWREAYNEAERLVKKNPRKMEHPKEDDPTMAMLRIVKAKAEEIKNSVYAHGKTPEHLTEKQRVKIAMITENNNCLYRACQIKEMLRLLLKLKNINEAKSELKRWLWWASHSRIMAFQKHY